MLRRMFVAFLVMVSVFFGNQAEATPIKGWSVQSTFVDAQGNAWAGIQVQIVLTISTNGNQQQYSTFATTNALGQVTWNFSQPTNGTALLVGVDTRAVQGGYTTVTPGVYNGPPVTPANPFTQVFPNNCVVSKP